MRPSALFGTLGQIAPADTLWVTEAPSHQLPIGEHIRAGAPFSHMSAAGGGLGFGLPAALGAQLAAPGRPVVAVIGDGSMHYAITALWTAAAYEIPLTIVVPSNGEYGVLKQFAMLEQTSRSVAVKRTLSDFSLRAMCVFPSGYTAQSCNVRNNSLRALEAGGVSDMLGEHHVHASPTARGRRLRARRQHTRCHCRA